VFTRFLEWILFGGVVGAIPLVADGLVLYWRNAFTWETFMAKGEALLVGAVLAGSVIGKLALWDSRHKSPKLIAICACVVSMAVSSWQYAAFRYSAATGRDSVAAGVVLGLYLFALFSSVVAATISE